MPFGNHSLPLASTIAILNIAQSLGCPLDYQLVSPKNKRNFEMSPFMVKADTTIAEVTATDLVIVSPIDTNVSIDAVLQEAPQLFEWIRQQYTQGAEVVSLCTGAYILAATGLLNGKEAASHFSVMTDLRQRFSEVNWQKDAIITEKDRVITSGGALSSLNALIYWLLKYYDRHKVLSIAKKLQIDYPRTSQKPYYIFSNQKKHQDELVLKVQEYMEQYQGESLNFDTLAERHHISRRSLNRRFKSATGESLRSYQQRIIIEKAKEQLEYKNITVQELAYRLGYVDVASFRNLFYKVTGTLPNEYQKKFALIR